MHWNDLSEDQQLDLLALYVTGNLPIQERQELAKAALESPELFASLVDLSSLKRRLSLSQPAINPVLKLWRRLRDIALPDLSSHASVAALASVILVIGL